MKEHPDYVARGMAFSVAGLVASRDGNHWFAAAFLLIGAYSAWKVLIELVSSIRKGLLHH
jgi:hypothetical protein